MVGPGLAGRAAPAGAVTPQQASAAALPAATLYRLLQLRARVFVVEQRCAYDELDGRDLEPGTVHCWIADGADVLACLRVLRDADGGVVIGRVATAPAARGRGLAAALMTHALGLAGGRVVTIEAQAQLETWYGSFGFVRAGEPYLEACPGNDGIVHIPMRRD